MNMPPQSRSGEVESPWHIESGPEQRWGDHIAICYGDGGGENCVIHAWGTPDRLKTFEHIVALHNASLTSASESRSTNAAPQDSGRVGASQSHDPAVAAPASSASPSNHAGHVPDLERVRLAHSFAPPSMFKETEGGHRVYSQSSGEACYLCVLLAEIDRLKSAASAISAHEAVLKCAELVDGHDRVIALRMIRDFAATLSAIAEGTGA